MNEEPTIVNTTKKSGMNPMMIIGVIALVALAAFLIMRSNAQQAGTDSSTTTVNTTVNPAGTVEEGSPEAETFNDTPDTPIMNEEGNETNSDMTDQESSDVEIVAVEGGSFYYKPNEIRVKKGQKVRVEMKSVDMMHDFVIDELDVKSEIAQAGDTATVEFVADTVGEFEFYCSVGQHRANGMVGTLVVEE